MGASGKPKLKTRNVFLDTSVLIDENFALKSTAFKSLMSLCRLSKSSLKLTDVTIFELESKIGECLAGANEALNTKTRFTRILRNFDRGGFGILFQPLDTAGLQAELMRVLQSEFKEAKAEVLAATKVNAAKVFERYFQKKPPFGSGKKKAEFPDAFALIAIEEWCSQKKQTIYVVSSDGDMQSMCSDKGPLFHLESIGEFVDLVLREEDDEAEFLAQFFIDNPKPIVDAVTRQFEDRYVYLEDEDGDGEASVSGVELGSAAVVSLEGNEAVLELDATISFTAQVSYRDPDMEWHSKSADLEREEIVPVEVTIKFERGKHLNYEVIAAKVNNGESVHVDVDEDARTHWK